MKLRTETSKRLTANAIAIILLTIGLCLTSLALIWTSVSVNNSLFHTGTVKVNLNDGKPIIDESEFCFEPGMTVQKSFFIQNEGSSDAYYKLYFDQVSGELADVLEITVSDDDTVLYRGTARTLSEAQTSAANAPLLIGEKRDLTVTFYFPEELGNAVQNATLSFDLCADAVQAKNNTDRQFD